MIEELGKNLVPTPLLGTTLAELALLAADEPDTDALEALAEGTKIGAVVFDAEYVINGDIATARRLGQVVDVHTLRRLDERIRQLRAVELTREMTDVLRRTSK